MIGDIDLVSVAFLVVCLVVALVLHEWSHGRTADRLGDHTPRMSGRLTLNPMRHIDPFGTVILPGLLLLPTLFGQNGPPVFAYAKPMPFTPGNLKDPDRQTMWIAVAGPVMNLVLAVLGGLVLRAVSPEAGRFLAENSAGGTAVFRVIGEQAGLLPQLLAIFVFLNVLLAVFNVMPVPPLDGSKVLARFLPPRAREVYKSWDQYGALFILAIFFFLPSQLFGLVSAISRGLLTIVVG